MKNKKTIEALNVLMEINNNRIEGYTTASKYNKDEGTKNILFQLRETCKNCKTELISEILQLGGVPSKGIKGTSRLFNLLVSFRNTLGENLHKTTLNSCSYREGAAVDAYNKILNTKSGHITDDLASLLTAHYISVKNNHHDVKDLQMKYKI